MITRLPHVSDDGEDLDEKSGSEEDIKRLLQRAEQRFSNSGTPAPQSSESAHHSRIPKLTVKSIAQPYVSTASGVARLNRDRRLNSHDREASESVRRTRQNGTIEHDANKEKRANAGFDFFDMPATQLSPALQTDMRLLKFRGVLDPQRHYKKDSSNKLIPDFSEVGRIIEGPTEYFSARLPKRKRKATLVEEVLANETSTGRFKSKYNEIQVSKSSGKRAHYKRLQAKRSKSMRRP